MRNHFCQQPYLILAAVMLACASCSDAPKGDDATVTSEQKTADALGDTYSVDTANSYIHFTGNGVGKNHPGKFHISSGQLAASGNTITAGQFVIDVNSIQMEEQGDMIQGKLRPHLLSADFFDAAKYGTAKFEITRVEPFKGNTVVKDANYNVSGNLTLKNTTKNVSFPANITMNGGTLKAKANFDIDRTQWGMIYGNDKSLGDKFISEKVNIELNLEAGKQ